MSLLNDYLVKVLFLFDRLDAMCDPFPTYTATDSVELSRYSYKRRTHTICLYRAKRHYDSSTRLIFFFYLHTSISRVLQIVRSILPVIAALPLTLLYHIRPYRTVLHHTRKIVLRKGCRLHHFIKTTISPFLVATSTLLSVLFLSLNAKQYHFITDHNFDLLPRVFSIMSRTNINQVREALKKLNTNRSTSSPSNKDMKSASWKPIHDNPMSINKSHPDVVKGLNDDDPECFVKNLYYHPHEVGMVQVVDHNGDVVMQTDDADKVYQELSNVCGSGVDSTGVAPNVKVVFAAYADNKKQNNSDADSNTNDGGRVGQGGTNNQGAAGGNDSGDGNGVADDNMEGQNDVNNNAGNNGADSNGAGSENNANGGDGSGVGSDKHNPPTINEVRLQVRHADHPTPRLSAAQIDEIVDFVEMEFDKVMGDDIEIVQTITKINEGIVEFLLNSHTAVNWLAGVLTSLALRMPIAGDTLNREEPKLRMNVRVRNKIITEETFMRRLKLMNREFDFNTWRCLSCRELNSHEMLLTIQMGQSSARILEDEFGGSLRYSIHGSVKFTTVGRRGNKGEVKEEKQFGFRK